MAGNPWLWSFSAAANDLADPSINWQEGQSPGSVNASARGMMAALASLFYDNNGSLITAGAANAYTLAAPNINYPVNFTGLTISAKANFTNSAGATLNVNSLGAKNIRVHTPAGEAALSAGQIQSGGHYNFQYDTAADSAAGAWLLLNPTLDTAIIFQPGFIIPYAAATAPVGWLLCYGQAVSRTTYVSLFNVISTTYGVGDNVNTFNLPDLRGRAVFGGDNMGGVAASRVTNAGSGIVGTTLGATGGAESVTLSTSQIPSHTHTGTTNNETTAHTHSGTSGNASADHTHNGTTDGANADHTHSGTTGNDNTDHFHNYSSTSGGASADHTHGVSGTTSDQSVTHTHQYESHTALFGGTSGGGQANTGSGNPTLGSPNTTTGNASVGHTHTFSVTSAGFSADHTHAIGGTTGGVTINHQHAFTSGNQSQTHGHAYTTSGASATHNHTITTGNQSLNHNHTFTSDATGGGALHTNMPPAIMLSYIIKT